MADLKHIGELFGLEGEYIGAEQIKTGNINQTYRVKYFRDGEEKPYTIQKVNTYVFKNPENVMANIGAVTEHIRSKVKSEGGSAKRAVLHFLYKPGTTQNFLYDEEGNFWRGYRYIDDSVTYDDCTPEILREAGRQFGEFQKQMADFDASTLFESIPNFHNTRMRFDNLFKAAEEDKLGRVKDVKEELDYLHDVYDLSCTLCDMQARGEIPLRVTHNDTKCNNVLFDLKTNKAIAVIDLDTVMPGLCAYDFGDAIRFGANNTIEDDPDTSKIFLDMEKYEAYVAGFIGTLKDTLTPIEIETMHLGAYIMTTELVARFMLDYLEGDVYFKLNYPEHNLVRTKAQAALAKDMDKKLDKMKEIVLKYAK